MRKAIVFVMHGYKKPVHDWFYSSLDFFDRVNLPLKAVNYYINDRHGRSSIKTFISKSDKFDIETLSDFSIFQGKVINYPATWWYRVEYDKKKERMIIFFYEEHFAINNLTPESLEGNIIFQLIKYYLTDTIVDFGYLYHGDPCYYTGGVPEGHGINLKVFNEEKDGWSKVLYSRKTCVLEKIKGVMRNVYKVNLIDEKILNFKNENFDFRQWINKGEHGTLEKIGQGNWLWRVPEDKVYDAGRILNDQYILLGTDDYIEALQHHGIKKDKKDSGGSPRVGILSYDQYDKDGNIKDNSGYSKLFEQKDDDE